MKKKRDTAYSILLSCKMYTYFYRLFAAILVFSKQKVFTKEKKTMTTVMRKVL